MDRAECAKVVGTKVKIIGMNIVLPSFRRPGQEL